VIRGWLGHVNLATTNRYADINIRTKEAALRQCAPPPCVGAQGACAGLAE
jgi:integrase/recombinase XerD